jgi:hypothetical protein
MSVSSEFQRHLMQLVRLLRCEPGPESEALARRLEVVATDSGATLSARAGRVLESLGATTVPTGGEGREARATLEHVCGIILGR